MKYSFEIVFKERKCSYVTYTKTICVSRICIVAKNKKLDGFYFSKYVTKVEGKFFRCAGSHQYPELLAKKTVRIFIEDFPVFPQMNVREELKEVLFIENIKNT